MTRGAYRGCFYWDGEREVRMERIVYLVRPPVPFKRNARRYGK